MTPAEQGLHRRPSGTYSQRGPRKLLRQDWQYCEHRAQVREVFPIARLSVTLTQRAVHRANRVGYGFVVSWSFVTSGKVLEVNAALRRNSTTARLRKRVWPSTTRATSWETRYVLKYLMAEEGPQSIAAILGRASSAARWVIGLGSQTTHSVAIGAQS